jgi:hypothetical protein
MAKKTARKTESATNNLAAEAAEQSLEIIRTDTVISKLPAHNLFSQGGANIQININKQDSEGQTRLSWRVSFNPDFGEAGQLAYRIETLIINRRLDEVGRPVPAMIRLGSLNEICEELGISPSGANTNNIKRALQQNAGALISANLAYKGTDGSKHRLEATFTKYSVAFRGDELPNGERSDGVVILLNEQYRRVLNRAGTRPLDFKYLKGLTPSAQRFYEIISYQMYAALKHNYPEAKLSYSDYCIYSGQPRQSDAAEMNKRMYKIHKPHLDSGYIEKVTYLKLLDAEGNVDWLMSYVPGPKAKEEFERFNRRLFQEDHSRDLEFGAEEQGSPAEADALKLLRHFHLLARGKKNYQARAGGAELRHAADVLARLGYDGAWFFVEYALAEARKTNFEMAQFGGAMQYLGEAEAAWKETQRKQREQAGREESSLLEEFEQLQRAETREREVEARLGSLAPEAYAELAKEARQELRQRAKAALYWDEETMEASVNAWIRRRLSDEIA